MVAGLLACGQRPAVVRADVEAYLDRMTAWAPVEGETARAIERIFRTHFVDEAQVLHEINDSRPRIVIHLERVRAYHPRSEEARRVHSGYAAAWESLLRGYDAIEQGFSSGDYTKLARGRRAMENWRETLTEVARELRQLADEVGASPRSVTPT